MALMRTITLADAESVWFNSKSRKLVIQRKLGDVEILRIPEANTVFYGSAYKTPTIFVRSNPSLTLEMTEGQYEAMRAALIDPLLESSTRIK